jgi:hypothetical protein
MINEFTIVTIPSFHTTKTKTMFGWMLLAVVFFVFALVMFRLWNSYQRYCCLQKTLSGEREKLSNVPDIPLEEEEEKEEDGGYDPVDGGYDPDEDKVN